MGIITANGLSVLPGSVMTVPREGAWHCAFELDGDKPLSGKLTIKDSGLEFVGFVRRSDAVAGRVRVEAVGGNGGLSKVIDAKSYESSPLSIALKDILDAAGEALDPASDASVLGTQLDHWQRTKDTAGIAIKTLLEPTGATWRVTSAGKVWVGKETYPKQKIADALELDRDGIQGCFTIATDRMELRPGVTFDGRKVGRVEHHIQPNERGVATLRTIYWVEDDSGLSFSDRLKADLAAFIRWVTRDTRYHRSYACSVQGQDASGLLDLYPDDESIRGSGTSKVPIKHGLPGVKVKVSVGSRVMMNFENGDPRKPFASLWDNGGTQIEISVGASPLNNARQGDMIALTIPVVPAAPPAGAGFLIAPTAVQPPGTPAPPTAIPLTLYGIITTGDPKFKTGG